MKNLPQRKQSSKTPVPTQAPVPAKAPVPTKAHCIIRLIGEITANPYITRAELMKRLGIGTDKYHRYMEVSSRC